ncbi:MAG: FG-GAP repeat protein [Planctomycetes bacterium]|nr:FG-GAP repeat protein [Planctomycetota bacterium]MBI3847649.1 FG-GAP repeat protein [Planctomycetota bacterium]
MCVDRMRKFVMIVALSSTTAIGVGTLEASVPRGPDFNGDGFDDLPIGTIFEDAGGVMNSGYVQVLYGGNAGPGAGGTFHATVLQAGAETGWAQAWGDFDNDGFDDLVLGVPFFDATGLLNSGEAVVVYGSFGGLDLGRQQVLSQTTTNVPGVAETRDRFGFSVAVGDFDGDGFDDLAVGVPFESVGAAGNAGAVNVFYGSPLGIATLGSEIWSKGGNGITGTAEQGALLGVALTVGDFDGDGRDDLAIGEPRDDVNGVTNAGSVTVLYGSVSGLSGVGQQTWTQDSGLGGTAETQDSFGASLAAGDFDNDGFDDLVVGVAFENFGSTVDAGSVNVINGSAAGLVVTGNQIWEQATVGIDGAAEAGDKFGATLAVGDFDGDGFGDLAIGVPGEDVGATANAGAVNVLYGSATGLSTAGNQLWDQSTAGVLDAPEAEDRLGSSLVVGDFDGDGRADLAIGATFEGVGVVNRAGAVNVIFGTASGLDAFGNLFISQSSVGDGSASEPGDRFGWGVGSLF